MNRLFVIKVGGNIIDDDEKLISFLQSFASVQAHKILVHGGGKIATEIGNKLGIESKYINGRRITDDDTIDLVTMVYGGLINKKIVAQLQSLNCNAIGLTGADANIIPAKKRVVKDIDFGWVGDIESSELNTQSLKQILDAAFAPIFAPLTHDEHGHILNTNADTIASVLAISMSKHFDIRLIFCFEKEGVMKDVNDPNSVIRNLNKELYDKLLKEGSFHDGILPKLENSFNAIRSGVKEVLIGEHSHLLANTGYDTRGTLITLQ